MLNTLRSILDYDWRRLPLGWLRKTTIVALTTVIAATATPSQAQEAGVIDLTDIVTPIVPTMTNTGDRDFGGSPSIIVGVDLEVGQRGRAIFANVTMIASRGRLRTSVTERFMVWRWNPAQDIRRVQRILTRGVTLRFDNLPNGTGFGKGIVIRSDVDRIEDGGVVATRNIAGRGLVSQISLLGDTSGDDISTDRNPHGDTSIRTIRFRSIRVEFTPGLGG